MTPRVKPPVHRLRRTADEPFHLTRYYAPCGYTSTTKRDFSANYVRKDAKGDIVWIVTCQGCLNGKGAK